MLLQFPCGVLRSSSVFRPARSVADNTRFCFLSVFLRPALHPPAWLPARAGQASPRLAC